MKIYQINDKTSYINDSVHWFGPFSTDKEIEVFLFEDSQEEQWFAAVRNKIVIDLLNSIKERDTKARRFGVKRPAYFAQEEV